MMTYCKLPHLALMAALCVPVANGQSRNKPPETVNFKPHSGTIIWELDIINGYPFVRSQIGTSKGVLMIDNGTASHFLLNSKRVEANVKQFGTVTVSGYKSMAFLAERIPEVKIAGQTWKDIRNVLFGDLFFFEEIVGSPPLLGFLGYGFFKDCEIDLDYDRHLLILRKLDREGQPIDRLPDEFSRGKQIASLSFATTEDRPQHPVLDAFVGDIPVKLEIDTGSRAVKVPRRLVDYFLDQKWATKFRYFLYDKSWAYRLSGVKVGGRKLSLDAVLGMPLRDDEKRFDINEPHVLLAGCPFLKQFRTVWNFKTKEFVLYTP
jgi:hypothetical protein